MPFELVADKTTRHPRSSELKRLKGAAYRATTALKRLGVISNSSATTSNSNSIAALLKKIEEYVENLKELEYMRMRMTMRMITIAEARRK